MGDVGDAGGVTIKEIQMGRKAPCPLIANVDGDHTSLGIVLVAMQTDIDTLEAAGVGGTLADGKVIVGNVSNVATAVDLSGDVTVDNAGAVTIAAGAVDEAMLAVPTADALNVKRILRATYDFAVDGGTISVIGLGVSLPDNAIVTRSWYEVITTFESSTDAATVSLSIPTDDVDGIVTAVAISTGTPWDAGYQEGIQDGTAAAFTVKTTAARELSMEIAVEAVTAGKMVVFCEYVVSD